MVDEENILIDPPSGHRYGYPKVAPRAMLGCGSDELKAWLIETGYPKDLIDDTIVNHCRFIY